MGKFIARLFILVWASILIVGPPVFAAETIKVGIVDTYSGGAAVFGIDMLDGFKMAVNEINAKGGVLGKKLEFVTRDEKFKPDL